MLTSLPAAAASLKGAELDQNSRQSPSTDITSHVCFVSQGSWTSSLGPAARFHSCHGTMAFLPHIVSGLGASRFPFLSHNICRHICRALSCCPCVDWTGGLSAPPGPPLWVLGRSHGGKTCSHIHKQQV